MFKVDFSPKSYFNFANVISFIIQIIKKSTKDKLLFDLHILSNLIVQILITKLFLSN